MISKGRSRVCASSVSKQRRVSARLSQVTTITLALGPASGAAATREGRGLLGSDRQRASKQRAHRRRHEAQRRRAIGSSWRSAAGMRAST